jgi:uncharacterized protein YlaI
MNQNLFSLLIKISFKTKKLMNNQINLFLLKKKIADVILKLLTRINSLHFNLKFAKNLLESILNLTQHRKKMNSKNQNRIEKKKNKFKEKKIKKMERINKSH